MIQDTYKTKDLFEASFLHSVGLPLNGLSNGGNYYWFEFSNQKQCQELSTKYWAKTAQGNIKTFVDSLKTLKDLVFSRKGAYDTCGRSKKAIGYVRK